MAKPVSTVLHVRRPRVAPRNNRTRAERIAAWNASHQAAAKYGPSSVEGKNARYLWITAVHASDLKRTTRHVAHALAQYGTPAGRRIFPGIRDLAKRCGLSTRCACTHIEHLVRRGFLLRRPRGGERSAGAHGFEYALLIPKLLQQSGPVLNAVQHGVERRAAGVKRNDMGVLKGVPPISSLTIHITHQGPRAPVVDNRARAAADALGRKLLAELAAGGLSRAEITSRGFPEAIAYAAAIGCAIKPSAGESAEVYRRRVNDWEQEHPRVDAWPDREGQLRLGKGLL
ncbi:MAG: helix-turn-helix domain-containing protein [Terriglobales bacterium]